MCQDDECEPSSIGRRIFLSRATSVLGGLSFYPASAAWAEDAPPPTRVLDHPGVEHGPLRFRHNGRETIGGYLARPKIEGRFPAVLVIAGNRITEEYIPNTCAALAVAGFVSLAPDIFHPLTEASRTGEPIHQGLAQHTEFDVLEDLFAGANFLKTLPFVKAGEMGIVGFCFGGRMALIYGNQIREIGAVVAFHPGPVTQPEVSLLTAPVQMHHGTADRSVSHESTRKLEEALRRQGTRVELFLYEGADHGFLAYTRPFYHPDHAKQAWGRTVEFLGQTLRKPNRSE